MGAMDNAVQNGQGTEAASSSGRRKSRRRSSERAVEKTWTEIVKEDPILFLSVAAVAGFVVGGGARSRGGIALLTMAGKFAAREMLADFFAPLVDEK
jgi:hypothetical protein